MDTFVDNGNTGVNFQRPAFQKLMETVKKGSINCIVVKDLSRFGRNYIETGEYLEKIFPYLGVRFISINDNFDSLDENNDSTLIISLKGILHDTYAKDISKKVSTALDIKKKSGKFMGKIPPYGYIRSTENRYQLVVHKERARVIKNVYNWRLGGMGVVSIAHKLNDLEIPSQLKLRWIEGFSDGRETALWHGSSVIDILRNPCYTGCIVERKGHNELYKGKPFQTVPRSQWKLIRNTHKAIIDEETFYKIQNIIEESACKRHHIMR
jgi:DNA invertase Pin-like site-specific DNA recombinase